MERHDLKDNNNVLRYELENIGKESTNIFRIVLGLVWLRTKCVQNLQNGIKVYKLVCRSIWMHIIEKCPEVFFSSC